MRIESFYKNVKSMIQYINLLGNSVLSEKFRLLFGTQSSTRHADIIGSSKINMGNGP